MIKVFDMKQGRSRVSHRFLALPLAAAVSLFSASYGGAVLAQDDDEQRQPPSTRTSDTLSERVFNAISDIQEMLSPEDADAEPDLEGAKRELDELNERYDRLNDFEKSTLLNFYTQYYLTVDDMDSALATFERILTIENLRLEMRLRSLMALGQLYQGEEGYEESIEAFDRWRELSEEENATVFLGLTNAHYNLDNYETAIPYLLQHIDMLAAEGREIQRNKYGMLNNMHISLERYEDALDVTKQMVTLYNNPADWRNLAAIYGYLEEDQKRIETLALAFSNGFMEREAEFLNLASSLAGIDMPYKGAKVMEQGMEQGIVEQDAENLERLTQMYLMANEYEMALEPARMAADSAETGDAYDRLAYVHYLLGDYESTVENIRTAIDLGNLDDEADAQLLLSRSLVELDRYEEANEAARRADELGNNTAERYIDYIARMKARYDSLEAQKQEAIEFYRS